MMEGFHFDPDTHTYTVDGKPVPSVTQLAAILGEDADISDDIIERAAERGVVMHGFIEDMLSGYSFEECLAELPGEYEPYAYSVKSFFEAHDIRPLMIESRWYSAKLGMAGTVDLVCTMDGGLAILDYKFVSQVAKTKAKAQLNAYRMLLADNEIFVEQLYIVQFLPDRYRLYPVAIGGEEVLHCLKNYEYRCKKHPRGRIE